MIRVLGRQLPSLALGLLLNGLLLYGVVVLGWSPGSIVCLFPVESIGLGLITAALIARQKRDEFSDPRLGLIVFGSVYGAFTVAQTVMAVIVAWRLGVVADAQNLWLPLALVLSKIGFDLWDTRRRTAGLAEIVPPPVIRGVTLQMGLILGLTYVTGSSLDTVHYSLGGHAVTTAMMPVVTVMWVKSVVEVVVALLVAVIVWLWYAMDATPAAASRD